MKRIALPVIAALAFFSPVSGAHAVDVSRLDMNAAPTLNQDQVRRVQQALQKKGFTPGPIDGHLGPHTKSAIRKFQDRYAIQGNGDTTTRRCLRSANPISRAKTSQRFKVAGHSTYPLGRPHGRAY